MTQDTFNELMDAYLAVLTEKEPNDWSSEARQWAESAGIVKGNGNGDKQYKSFCTREQMVVFLKRLAELVKAET